MAGFAYWFFARRDFHRYSSFAFKACYASYYFFNVKHFSNSFFLFSFCNQLIFFIFFWFFPSVLLMGFEISYSKLWRNERERRIFQIFFGSYFIYGLKIRNFESLNIFFYTWICTAKSDEKAQAEEETKMRTPKQAQQLLDRSHSHRNHP